MCKIIDELPQGVSNLERAFAAASLYYNYSGSENCFDVENYTDPHDIDDGWGWQVFMSLSFTRKQRICY